VKFAFIAQEKGSLPVPAMCKNLKVSESGFYHWSSRRGRADRRKRNDEAELQTTVQRLHRKHPSYGRPRMLALLRLQGHRVGGNRLRRIMLELGISGRCGRKRLRRDTEPPTKTPASPNLLERNFDVGEPNTVWAGDITELRVGQGKLRMAIVLDLGSRTVVGRKLDPRMKADLVIGALQSAVRHRKPPKGLIFHSDQGVQYTSNRFREMLRVLEIRQSMSRRGNCWDNAPTESFFATLKKELIYTRSWVSVAELERAIARYIRYYNRDRIHTTLGLRSPQDHEQHHAA
jgi:transposase InsO family protein